MILTQEQFDEANRQIRKENKADWNRWASSGYHGTPTVSTYIETIFGALDIVFLDEYGIDRYEWEDAVLNNIDVPLLTKFVEYWADKCAIAPHGSYDWKREVEKFAREF